MLGAPLLWAARHTAFPHFCGGERLEECAAEAQRLARARVRCIIDWSIEEDEDEAAWDNNAARKMDVLQRVSEVLGESAAFMPLKLTALLSPGLLERLTVLIELGDGADPLENLSAEDSRLFHEATERLSQLCEVARKHKVSLLLDAEQSNRQPAVHLFARELQRRFNIDGAIVVYDTFQMYLRASQVRLDDALEAARADNYTFAVKLVRGAYIEQEGPLDTVHPAKEDTHRAYDAAAAQLLNAIAQRGRGDASVPSTAVMLATHNRASLEQAVAEMSRLDLQRDDPRVYFAQILGMVDNLTTSLGLAGYNSAKLVVFGNLREVLPWLLRRVQENRDAFGAQAHELPVLRREIRRRVWQ